MATDVVNTAGAGTGSSQNGNITVMGNRNNRQQQAPPLGTQTFLIAGFDLATAGNGTDLADRFDDPRYYQGDAVT